jgi:iron complex outermembrane recepter protein
MHRDPRAWVALLAVSPAVGMGTTGEPTLEEIVVTAQKRPALAMDLPISLFVFSRSDLENLAVSTPGELAGLLPNVGVHNTLGNGNPAIIIRGVGLQDFNSNTAPSVGLYVDEVYQPSIAMAGLAFFDAGSVEILKGPQGALWGRNTIAGAVLVQPAIPTRTSLVEATLGAGSYDEIRASLVVNEPIGETAAARVSLFTIDQRSGWFDNRYLGDSSGTLRRSGGRAQWSVEPSATTRVRFAVSGELQRGDSYQTEHVGLAGPECPISMLPPGVGKRDDTRCSNPFSGYQDPDGDPDTGDWNTKPRIDNSSAGATLRVDHELRGGTTLTSLTSWQTFDLSHGADGDASPFRFIDLEFGSQIDSVAQELRLSSAPTDGTRPFAWIVGASAARDTHTEDRTVNTTDFLPDIVSLIALEYDQTVRSFAAFAQGEYLLTGDTTLSLGLRYTRDELEFSGGTAPVPGQYDPDAIALVFPGLPSLVERSTDNDDVSGRLALSHEFRDALLVYGSYSRGYKAGGVFGGFGLTSQAFTPYDPETLHALELGLKWHPPNARIGADAAVFSYDYHDLQALTLVSYPFGVVPQLTNIGKARIYGFELSATARPAAGVDLNLQVGTLDTRIESSAPAIDSLQRPIRLQGNELARAPSVSALAQVAYSRAANATWTWRATAIAQYQDDLFSDLQNQTHLSQPSVTQFNVGLQAWTSDNRWNLALRGLNLTDERPVIYGNSSGAGNDFLFIGEPRRWMAEIRRRW